MLIYYNESRGLTASQQLNLLLVVESIFMLFYLIRVVLWFLKERKENSFFEYVFWSDRENLLTDVVTCLFLMISLLVIIVYLLTCLII